MKSKATRVVFGLVSALGVSSPAVQAADMPESWRPNQQTNCSVLPEMSFFQQTRFLKEHPECRPARKVRSGDSKSMGAEAGPRREPVTVATTAEPTPEPTRPSKPTTTPMPG